jgi:hypothetical protein
MIVSAMSGDKGALKQAQYRRASVKDATALEEYDYYLRGHAQFMKEGIERSGEIWRDFEVYCRPCGRCLRPHTRRQLLSDLPDVDSLSLVSEGGSAGDHRGVREARERRNDVFGHPV